MDTTPTSTGSHRGWIWYFVIVALLATVAISVNIAYNLSLQLKPEHLEEARQLWQKNGPRDYDLEYVKSGPSTETFAAKIRRGRVIAVTLDGRPLEKRLYGYHDVPALFTFMERFYELDHEPGKPRTYARALFDPADGHPVYYLRSVFSTRERIEITVKLTPVDPNLPPMP
jgi:hypothetical protein